MRKKVVAVSCNIWRGAHPTLAVNADVGGGAVLAVKPCHAGEPSFVIFTGATSRNAATNSMCLFSASLRAWSYPLNTCKSPSAFQPIFSRAITCCESTGPLRCVEFCVYQDKGALETRKDRQARHAQSSVCLSKPLSFSILRAPVWRRNGHILHIDGERDQPDPGLSHVVVQEQLQAY